MIDGKPEAKRLVAAYIVGIGLPQGFFGKAYKTVGICRRPDDTGCVVSWNSFVPGSDVTAYLAHSESRYVDRFGDDPSKAILCINPLTFDLDRPAGDAKLHLGAVRDAASIASPVPGLVGAECKNGILFVDAGGAAGVLKPLPTGSLHLQDIELFYGNLRQERRPSQRRVALTRERHTPLSTAPRLLKYRRPCKPHLEKFGVFIEGLRLLPKQSWREKASLSSKRRRGGDAKT